MERRSLALASIGLLAAAVSACGEDTPPGYVPPTINPARNPTMTFFVSSAKNMTGNLGGLAGADRICQDLADKAGGVGKTWRAYLSAERGGPNDGPVHARDRIGNGPWKNANGKMIAANLTDLHTRVLGDHLVFVDENARKINGQWAGSPTPNEHDILTGSNPDGTVAPGKTCADWTSASVDLKAQVGHSDGLGPMMNPSAPYNSWNSSHENMNCSDTAPRGGAGHFYCFAVLN
jgi:hypothetical protein